ncbi:carbon-nitrogen hydrolase family protein [Amycolatopsis granulosa]|uniref:carbon-nitrogen hydrolase family protein n=1 Tax=Amycolatopsis granulosa TaxID=185684 RepID=UPI001423B87B|nr:carbon-nitrogen hydrolase family protein [Amycolatopsis granulosa]NIH83834.1 putative amidohydrolase [Amycolatopsis granulosa]
MTTLGLAALQSAGTPRDVEANLAELDRAAAGASADVLVTPELFVTGYDVGDLTGLAQLDLTARVADIAARHGVAIVAGLPSPGRDGRVRNDAVFVDDTGKLLARYSKAHLYGDLDSRFDPGGEPPAQVTYRGVRFAVMICFDVEFPETVRTAALAGAEVVLVPTANMEPYLGVNDHLVWTRAWENQVFLAYVNRIGAEDTTRYVGRSRILAPDGRDLAQSGTGPDLLRATIDTAEVSRARSDFSYLGSRRPPLYRLG